MYFIVESVEQLKQLKQLKPEQDCFIQVISNNDSVHPKLATTSLIYYRNSTKGYIFPIKHSEGLSLDIELVTSFLLKHYNVYVLDAKYHSYFLDLDNYVDIYFTQLNKTNKTLDYQCNTKLHNDFYYRNQTIADVNEIIPITKHYEKAECLYHGVKHYIGLETDLDNQRQLIKAYKSVEELGVAIDEEAFKKAYQIRTPQYSIRDGVIYGLYNLYTLTARPTCTFNGVNLTAIPKEERFREAYTAKNEYLLEFDFDAYHLRLIAGLIGYQFPNPEQSVHEYLGKLYFGKETLSTEEYKESKVISFRQLYGGIDKRYRHIKFFNNLEAFIDVLWNEYTEKGQIELPTGRLLLKSKSLNKMKVFNYYIQNLETQENMGKLKKIHRLMRRKKYKSQIVLVTYDAFLLDFCAEDGKDVLIGVKDILQEGGMLVKYKYGTDYNFK